MRFHPSVDLLVGFSIAFSSTGSLGMAATYTMQKGGHPDFDCSMVNEVCSR